jgi:CBS domain-containing protein
MAEHQVRRLPVIDGHDLVGMLLRADSARSQPDEKTGDVVQEISKTDAASTASWPHQWTLNPELRAAAGELLACSRCSGREPVTAQSRAASLAPTGRQRG